MGSEGAVSTETPLVSLDSACDGVNASLARLAGQLNLVNARLVAEVESLLESGLWQQGGVTTPAGFLAWKLGVTPHRAGLIVQVAERRAHFPIVIGLFDRGEISLEQAAVAVEAPAWADAKIAHLVTISTPAKLRRAFRDIGFEDDPDADEPSGAPPSDTVSFGIGRDGRWRLNAELGIEDGRRVEAALTEHQDEMFGAGDESVTAAEAFVDVFDRSLDCVESPARRDRYRTWFHYEVGDGALTTTDGWRIPMAVEQRLLCDGVVQPVWEREGVPFSVGHAQHIVPERTRRIVERRDRGCRVPGCSATIVEIHHIIHWSDGGPTDTWNLLSLCPKHHQLHHQGLLGISGNADEFDQVVFTDTSGRSIPGVAPPDPRAEPPPTPAQPYDPPLRGRFDWSWIGLGWSHPNAVKKRATELAERQTALDAA